MERVRDLEAQNQELQEEVEILRGVLSLVKTDLHVKNEQIERLYQWYDASVLLIIPQCGSRCSYLYA